MNQVVNTEGIDIRVYDNRQLMGAAAAKSVSEKIRELLAEQEHVNIIFAAAPSQDEFLQLLCTAVNIDWTRVNAFHMDEYIGLPEEAPQGFGNFLRMRLFSNLPFKSVNYLNGNAEDIEKECLRYTYLLQSNPVDIVCMGIGENGHIAFNDPPVADFNDLEMVKEVELEQACRQQQVNDKCFTTLEEVPIHAITLTIPALMSASFIYCIVPGKTKAQAVYNTFYQKIDRQFPSSIIRKHPNATLFLDQESSHLL